MNFYTLKIEDPSTVIRTTHVDGTIMPMHEFKVSAVKLYREMTNSWLKVAKEEIEKVLNGNIVYMKDLRDQFNTNEPLSINEFMVRFRDIGFIMKGPISENNIRNRIKRYIDANRFNQAIELIETLRTPT